MPKTEIPPIEELKLASLQIDYALSGRTEKEVRDNAKELAPMLAGGWSPSQPGEYFERGGKKHLAAGFTRHAAALANGHKVGYFVQVPDIQSELRTTAIRTNASKPISAFEQGRIYSAMRDGNEKTAEAGQDVLAPMAVKDIAEAVGKSRQHIDNCIAVFELPEELATLVTEGRVSAPVVNRAKQLVKDERKMIKLVKAAVANADKEGKDSATMKDLDAVKAAFIPLKAATKPEKAAAQVSPVVTATPITSEHAEPVADEKDGEHEQESEPPALDVPTHGVIVQSDLFSATPQPEAKPVKKGAKKDHRALRFAAVAKWSEDTTNAISDEEINQLLDAIEDADLKFNSPF